MRRGTVAGPAPGNDAKMEAPGCSSVKVRMRFSNAAISCWKQRMRWSNVWVLQVQASMTTASSMAATAA
jgi:hypothetical protein